MAFTFKPPSEKKLDYNGAFLEQDFHTLMVAYDLIRSGRTSDGVKQLEGRLTALSKNWRDHTTFGNKAH